MDRERHVLERAVQAVADQAAAADKLIGEAIAAGFDGSNPLTVHAKMLRLELLKTKAALERELGTLVLAARCRLAMCYLFAGSSFR